MATRETAISIDDSDDEEEALRYAIKMSLEDQHPAEEEKAPSSGLLSLDRKQMEAERLARLAKKRGHPGDATASAVQAPASKRQRDADMVATQQPESGQPLKAKLPYAKGIVKKTWVQGYPRTGDDVKIEEVLQRDQLELAVISSFQWDEEWMLSKFNLAKTKLLLVAFAGSEAQVSCLPLRLARDQAFTTRTEAGNARKRPPRHPVLLPAHERPRIYALQTTIAEVPGSSTNCGADRKLRSVRLGRERGSGECELKIGEKNKKDKITT